MSETSLFSEKDAFSLINFIGKETGEFDGRSAPRLAKKVYAGLKEKYNGQGPTVEGVVELLRAVLLEERFRRAAGEVNFELVSNFVPAARYEFGLAAKKTEQKEISFMGRPSDLPSGEWSEQAERVLRERYLWRDTEGNIIETPDEMCWRVAFEVALAETNFGKGDKVLEWAREYYKLMVSRKFLPNSPTLMNAGKKNGLQYSACFVLPVGDSLVEIFDAVKYASIIHQSGGGTGFSFSRLRPSGSVVKSTRGISSGPISFLRVFNAATQEIKQGGTRRGANMGILRVDHPDILEFIHCKEDGGITNFNISVAVTDKFMEAVKLDSEYELVAPHTGKAVGKISAKRVFDEICDAAHRSGDPGMIFIDRMNDSRANPVPSLGPIESTNPCGEQPLYPYDACNLGSIFLTYFVKEEGGKKVVDFEELARTVRIAVRFLDSVIERNPYPLPQINDVVRKVRRIGLGVGGWADMLAQLEIPYDSDQAFLLAERIMKFVNTEGHRTSEELAVERGPFPLWGESVYRNERPIRNGTVTTIAPTGTIAILANASSGIEPYFALAYRHIVKDKGLDRNLAFVNPYFEKALLESGLHTEEVMDKVLEKGVVGEIENIPDNVKGVFKTAHEVSPISHVRMQAAFQKYTDNSVSKTINLTHNALVSDIETAYLEAYSMGCMGITVFRDGCKGMQVLNAGTKEGDKKQVPSVGGQEVVENQGGADVGQNTTGEQQIVPDTLDQARRGEQQEKKAEEVSVKSEDAVIETVTLRPRPYKIAGWTYRVETPIGTAFITINSDEYGNPLEVFLSVGKGGKDLAADAEALGRLISLALRIPSSYSPKSVAEAIVDQLSGIGGSSALGFGNGRVRSLADAVAKVLGEHLKNGGRGLEDGLSGLVHGAEREGSWGDANLFQPVLPLTEKAGGDKRKRADLCSNCGNAALVFEEGCYKCYACGYSKC